jgi:hypothetical protein
VFCSTYQLPQTEVKINQQRNNLARVQMLHALAYRLLPNLMKVLHSMENLSVPAVKINFIMIRCLRIS